MSRGERRYVLDTNLFIDSFREATANHAMEEFHRLFAPFEYLCAVVAQELRSEARTPADIRRLERHVLGPYERRGRIIAPSARSWNESGNVLAELARHDGLELSRVSKAFANDVLLALCCREFGMVLVTENRRDFARIDAVAHFAFVDPWPQPIA